MKNCLFSHGPKSSFIRCASLLPNLGLKHCSFLLPLFFQMRQRNEAWFIRARLPEDLTMQTASSAARYHCSRLTQIHSDAEHSLQALDTVLCPLQGKTGRKQDKTWAWMFTLRIKERQTASGDKNIHIRAAKCCK